MTAAVAQVPGPGRSYAVGAAKTKQKNAYFMLICTSYHEKVSLVLVFSLKGGNENVGSILERFLLN